MDVSQLTMYVMVFVFCFCELGSHNVTQAGLELIAIFLPLPPGQLLRLQEIPPMPVNNKMHFNLQF